MQIELPFPKIEEKGKIHNLTVNKYRNAHFRHLSKAKKDYAEICRLKLLPYRRKRFEKVRLTYVMYSKNEQRRDLSNFCAVVDKFFSDVLVSMKIIKDDDTSVVVGVNNIFGGYGEDKFVVVVEEVV